MNNKYILYVSSGGLAHMLSGLSLCIEYAKTENRILIIDMYKGGYFQNNFSNFFILNENIKIEESYDSINDEYYDNISIKEFKLAPLQLINDKYTCLGKNLTNTLNINNTEKIVIYCGCGNGIINNNIFVKDDIKNIIKLKCVNLIKSDYLSIHYRNTDIKTDINIFINIINKNKDLLKKNNIKKIFIASDDYDAFEKFNKALNKDFKLFKVSDIINSNGKALHYSTEDRYKVTIDMLTDIYLILNSKYFIQSKKSGISKWINRMNNNNINIFQIKSKFIILNK
jgi:hypothetical protein